MPRKGFSFSMSVSPLLLLSGVGEKFVGTRKGIKSNCRK